jgi:hypothetical protein
MWIDHSPQDRIMVCFFLNQALLFKSMSLKSTIVIRFSSSKIVASTSFYVTNFFGSLRWPSIPLHVVDASYWHNTHEVPIHKYYILQSDTTETFWVFIKELIITSQKCTTDLSSSTIKRVNPGDSSSTLNNFNISRISKLRTMTTQATLFYSVWFCRANLSTRLLIPLVGKTSSVAHPYMHSVAHGWYSTESSPQK